MVKIFLQFLTVFGVFKLQCIFFCLNYWSLTEVDNFCICLFIFPFVNLNLLREYGSTR